MQKITVSGSATAEFGDRTQTKLRAANKPIEKRVSVVVEIEGDGAMDDQATDETYLVLRREAERIAQKAAVSARDQIINRSEAERIRAAPKDRSHVVVAAGTKDPESVQVLRGSVMVGKRKMTAAKGEQS